MRTLQLGATAGLLLLATFLLWLWVEQPPSSALAGGDRSAESGASSGAVADEGSVESSDAEGATSVGSRVALASTIPDSVEEGAARHAPGERPRLRGRVVDGDGDGVAGASVAATTKTAWIQLPLEVEPEGLPRSWFSVEATTTDAEGRFQFDDLEPGPLRLAVRASGFSPAQLPTRGSSLELPDVAEHVLEDIVLRPGVVLEGRVVDRGGKPVPGAAILESLDEIRDARGSSVSLPGRGVPLATTDAEGAFVVDCIAPGPWTLIADAPGYAVAEESGRTEREGERRSGIVIRLERGFEILGHVRASSGELPEGLRVSARPSPESDSPEGAAEEEEDRDAASRRRARHAVCAADGSFVLRGLAGGTRYAVSLWEQDDDSEEWGPVSSTAPVHAYAGQRGVELTYEPGTTLVLRVLDADSSAPLTDLTVWAGIGRLSVLRDTGREVRHAFPDGVVRYEDLRRRRNADVVHVRVAATGYEDLERKDIPNTGPGVIDLGEVRLERRPLVTVTVIGDATGEPVEGARVVLGTQTDEELRELLIDTSDVNWGTALESSCAQTDARGIASLTGRPGERVGVAATAKGFLPSEPLRLQSSEGEDAGVEVRLRRGGKVVVAVRDPHGHGVAGIGVDHRTPEMSISGPGSGDFDGDPSARTDAAGLAEFDALEAGVHAFRVRDEVARTPRWMRSEDGGEGTEGWVEVVAAEGSDSELEFEVPARGGLQGVVREGGQPLEDARLRLIDPSEPDQRRFGGWGGFDDPSRARTDASGRYRYEDRRSGDYVLEVSHPSRRMPSRFPVRIEDPPRRFDVDLDVAMVEGRVFGEDGSPLAGIDVQCLNASDENESSGSWKMLLTEDDRGQPRFEYRQEATRSETTDAGGRYCLRGLRPGEPLKVRASGDFVRVATSPEFTLGPDEVRGKLDFRLESAGVIQVAIEGQPSGRRSPPYMLRAFQLAEDGKATLVHQRNLGSWSRRSRLTSLAPGRYRVELRVLGQDEDSPLREQQVDVVGGETRRVEFRVP